MHSSLSLPSFQHTVSPSHTTSLWPGNCSNRSMSLSAYNPPLYQRFRLRTVRCGLVSGILPTFGSSSAPEISLKSACMHWRHTVSSRCVSYHPLGHAHTCWPTLCASLPSPQQTYVKLCYYVTDISSFALDWRDRRAEKSCRIQRPVI